MKSKTQWILIMVMFGFLVQPTCAEVLDEALSSPPQSESLSKPKSTPGTVEDNSWTGKLKALKDSSANKWNDFRASKKALDNKDEEIERLRYQLETLQDKFVIYQNGGRDFTDNMDAVCAFYRNGGLRDTLRGDK